MKQETYLVQAIMSYLAILENRGLGYFFRNNSFAGHIQRRDGTLGYVQNNKRGAPDICGIYRGKFIGIEVKTKTGRISPLQLAAKEAIEKAGGTYLLVRDSDAVVAALPLSAD